MFLARHLTVIFVVVFAIANATVKAEDPARSRGPRLTDTTASSGNDRIDLTNRYIITLKSGADIVKHVNLIQSLHFNSATGKQDANDQSGISHQYNLTGFQGYAGKFDDTVIRTIKASSDVASVESDNIFTAASIIQQRNAGWGLVQISHRAQNGTRSETYTYDDTAGVGTWAYILDSGIRTDHNDFGDRAIMGYNAVRTETPRDTTGHGTHVAGLTGGSKFGVAKRCELIGVKVLHGETGSLSEIIDGFNWAANHITQKRRQRSAVINMAVYGPVSPALNSAIDAASGDGVTTVACAGNTGSDVENTSPGSALSAITVSATDLNYRRAKSANYGEGVDIFAPGVDIESDHSQSTSATTKRSGTSMAAAYVAGVVLCQKHLRHLPDAMSTKDYILKTSTQNLVRSAKGGKNNFLYNDSGQ